MTDLDRDAARARCEAATEGPWRQAGGNPLQVREAAESNRLIVTLEPHTLWPDDAYNAEFIAHARTDFPLALAALEAAEKERDVLKRENEAMREQVIAQIEAWKDRTGTCGYVEPSGVRNSLMYLIEALRSALSAEEGTGHE